MSEARDFIVDVTRIGASLRCEGDRLKLVPPSGRALPPDIIERGKVLKPALIELLREPSGGPADPDNDLQAAYAERQAVCEIDGGLQRTEAALLAAACVVPLHASETAVSRQAIVLHFADYLDRFRRQRGHANERR